MKLTLKLTSALLAITFLLFSANAYFMVHRQISRFHSDMNRELALLGSLVGSSIVESWHTKGEAYALQLLSDLDAFDGDHEVHWLTTEQFRTTSTTLGLQPDEVDKLLSGTQIYLRRPELNRRFLFKLLTVDPNTSGILQISRSLRPIWEYVREYILNSLLIYASLVLIGGLAMYALGRQIVGKPIERLIRMSREIGAGTSPSTAPPSGSDELSQLGIEMALMGQQLRYNQKRLEIEAAEKLRALEQLRHADRLASAGRLSAGIAHELGTPLSIISGQASMLISDSWSHTEALDSIRSIKSQAERMTRLIQQFLELARPRASIRSEVHVGSLTNNVIQMLSSLASKRGISFLLEDNTKISQIFADPMQLQQVLTNILMNAVHASQAKTCVTVRLDNETRPSQGNGAAPCDFIVISIIDQGSGIPDDDLPRIFDPFFTTKKSGEGTGLGLSIAHEIVREHRGSICVESKLGLGSTFSIVLPVEH